MAYAVPSPPRLSPVPAPAPQPDLTPAALFLPLDSVRAAHVERKLRLVVQILALDQGRKAIHILATASGPSPKPLLLLRADAVLLGYSQALTHARRNWFDQPALDTSTALDISSPTPEPKPKFDRSGLGAAASVAREPLSLRPGEWVTVVGWLEASGMAKTIVVPEGYTPPLDAVLDCIHVSMAREPYVGAVTRGDRALREKLGQ